MSIIYRTIPLAFCLASVMVGLVKVTSRVAATSDPEAERSADQTWFGYEAVNLNLSAPERTAVSYKWNLRQRELPLLELMEDRLTPEFDRVLSYPLDQFGFPIFKA